MRFQLKTLLNKLDLNRSLKVRVGLVTIGTALLLSFLLSLFAGHVSRNRIINSRGEFLSSLAFQMADKLDRGMFERYRDIQILASLEDIRQPDVSIEAKRKLIEKLQDTYTDYAWIGLTDTAGNVVASTKQLLEGESVAKRPWFQQAQKTPFAGDVHEALLLEKLLKNDTDEPLRFVDVAAPVMNDAGIFQGVIGAHLSWRWAEEIERSLLDPLEQLRNVEIVILSAENRVLLGPDSLQEEILSLESIQKGEANKIGYLLERWPNGVEYLTGFSPSQGYRDFDELGWTTLVRQSAQIAFGPARALQRQVFLCGAFLGILFALVSWLYARRIVNSILKLTLAANRIRQEEPNVVIPLLAGSDELSELSKSLHYLVQTLNVQKRVLTTANQQLQQDMQEQQRTERKIREQAALLDIATDAILVRSLEGIVQYWNRGAERMYGWSTEEACGQKADSLFQLKDSGLLETALKSVVDQGEWKGEFEKTAKSGKAVVSASRWTLVRDQKNNPMAILTVDTDITEAKQLEAQFLRAQRLESLGTLASGIAHDLNNALTPTIGAAQLLPKTLGTVDQKSDSLIKTLYSSAKRASDMVRQILAFARGIEGVRTPVQISHILEELKQVLLHSLPKDISIQMNFDTEPWLVLADATQLQQVFMNLCINARDAMPQGGSLTITSENTWIDEHYSQLYPEAQVGPYVVVSVTDTGIGMSRELIDRIFDPFYTTKEVGKGTGLGLSTIVGILKSHDGFIKVKSEKNKGSQFQVYLPAQESLEVKNTSKALPPNGQGEMVLVVDDEIVIQEITKTALESYGYRVVTASNGHEAIAQYDRHQKKIKVVLMDTMMPAMSGSQAIEKLTQLNPAIKIIATSGLAFKTTSDQVRHFLPKPYSIQDLLWAIDKILHSAS